jgi:hypothetical protein
MVSTDAGTDAATDAAQMVAQMQAQTQAQMQAQMANRCGITDAATDPGTVCADAGTDASAQMTMVQMVADDGNPAATPVELVHTGSLACSSTVSFRAKVQSGVETLSPSLSRPR